VTGRAELIAALQHCLLSLPAVDAAWEGGSAAFGSHDGLSDVDTVIVVADDAIDSTFDAIEAALNALSPVVLRYDTPGTVGFSQKFYRLRDAGEFLVADVVLIRRSDPLLFRELELHGQGTTWFDRRGVLVEAHLDLAEDLAKARARVLTLAGAFHMFQHIVTKERLRGRAVEALSFYQAMTMRPLIEALRLLHGPHTRIFGPRYLARDLPAAACALIERLSFVRDLEDLATKHAEARRCFEACLARLQDLGPGSGLEGLL
jgi:predicted nucleotidyltransferase